MTDIQQKVIDKINGEKCAFADQNTGKLLADVLAADLLEISVETSEETQKNNEMRKSS